MLAELIALIEQPIANGLSPLQERGRQQVVAESLVSLVQPFVERALAKVDDRAQLDDRLAGKLRFDGLVEVGLPFTFGGGVAGKDKGRNDAQDQKYADSDSHGTTYGG